jgi:hypothetical protein
MQTITSYQLKATGNFSADDLQKGVVLVLLHAKRIPPHVGLIIGKTYQSLTIKGHELNVSLDALLRTIEQKNKEAVFIKLKKHSTFSDEYLREHFIAILMQYKKVAEGEATCLHPIRLFFEEIYSLDVSNAHYVFDVIEMLKSNNMIEQVMFKNIESNDIDLPIYNIDDINDGIRKANIEAEEIKNKIKGEIKK